MHAARGAEARLMVHFSMIRIKKFVLNDDNSAYVITDRQVRMTYRARSLFRPMEKKQIGVDDTYEGDLHFSYRMR